MFSTIEYRATAIVCLISAIIIQRIFSKEKRRGANSKAIQGIMWFGLAIFVWGLGALINLIMIPYAIRAATYWPSLWMGVADTVGTVTEGKYADIIAVKGGVLRHISLLQDVDVILKHGKQYK